MRKLINLIFISLITLHVAYSQDKVGDLIALAEVPESVALVTQAQSYADAVVAADFTKVANMTHGDIVEMGGGMDYMVFDLKAEKETLTQQGLSYTSSEVGNHPEFYKSEGELQTIIPVKYHLVMNSKKVESWINLFASSADEGVTWKFVNLEKFDEASLREFVKNVSQDLVYPR